MILFALIKSDRGSSSENEDENTVCFNFEICFEIDKANTRGGSSKYPLLNYTLVGDALFSRVFFNETNTNIQNGFIEVNTNQKTCRLFNVLIKPDNSDFLRPIKFSLEYQFVDFNETLANANLADLKNSPIVHEDSNSYEFEANFKKDCGSDKKCVTDLNLQAEFVDLMTGDDNLPVLSFKESDSVTLAILLENVDAQAEPAYATQIIVDFDERLDFIRKFDDEPSGFTCAIAQTGVMLKLMQKYF